MVPELLTIPAAAERLGVSVKGLRAVAVREGFIVRIGRKPLIDAATLGVCAAGIAGWEDFISTLSIV